MTNGRAPRIAFGVVFHLRKRSADVGRQINLIDDKEIGTGDARAALGGDFVARRTSIT